MQFYPADYMRDTRPLSLSAKGAWMDFICAMWHHRARGVLSMRLSAYGRLIGTTEDRAAQIIDEIDQCGIADVEWTNDRQEVTITCRRIVRDWEATETHRDKIADARREAAKARWSKGKANEEQKQCRSNANAMQMHDISEARGYTLEERENAQGREESDPSPDLPLPPPSFPSQALAIASAYVRRDAPMEVLQCISDAIGTGSDPATILAKVKRCAQFINSAPGGSTNRYVPSARRFFGDRQWESPEAFEGRWKNESKPLGKLELMRAAECQEPPRKLKILNP